VLEGEEPVQVPAADVAGVGVQAASDKTADFGMLARDIKDSEVEKLGADYQSWVVARDALTVSAVDMAR